MKWHQRTQQDRRANHRLGFTLVEMSVVLIIIGLVILTVFPALTAMRTSSQRSLTDANMQMLLRSVAVYVQTNGCLPCPTPPNARGSAIGHVRGDTSTDACGRCTAALAEGVVPFASLGLPESFAHDGWGRWIRMRVDPALTEDFKVVPPTGSLGLCKASLRIASTSQITVQTPNGPAQPAALVLLSHGPNGYGAYQAGSAIPVNKLGSQLQFPLGTARCDQGQYEVCNSNTPPPKDPNSPRTFYNALNISTGSNAFDDVLVFIDRNNLVSLIGNNSCNTGW